MTAETELLTALIRAPDATKRLRTALEPSGATSDLRKEADGMDDFTNGRRATTTMPAPPQGPMPSKPTCQGKRSDGAPCGAPPGPTGLCFWHDPARREEMLAAARKGGERRTLSLPAEDPLEATEARGVLAAVLRAMLEGALDPNAARAAAYILQVERKIAEGDLDREVVPGMQAQNILNLAVASMTNEQLACWERVLDDPILAAIHDMVGTVLAGSTALQATRTKREGSE